MDPALELEPAPRAASLDEEDDVLQTPDAGRARVHDFDLPPLPLGVLRVHPREIGGEERRFVTAGARPNFDEDVLLVVRILRLQQDLELALEPWLPALELRKLTWVGQGGLADVAPGLVDAEVLGDAKQPVLEPVLAVESAEGLECPDKDLLGQVLGIGSAVGEVGDERVDPRVVALVQDGGGFLTPMLRLVDERTVGAGVGVGLKVKNALRYCHSALTPDSQTQPASTVGWAGTLPTGRAGSLA